MGWLIPSFVLPLFLMAAVGAGIVIYGLQQRVAIRHDITERKKVEDALQEQNTQLQMLANQMPAFLWATDFQLRFTSLVGAGLNILNLRPNQVIGRSVAEFIQASDSSNPMVAAHHQALQGQASVYEVEINGFIFQSYLEPLRDATGEIIGAVGVALDITDRKRAEQATRRQLEEITVLHAVANACVEESDEDTLIERVSKIIGSEFYPDNFGVILLDKKSGLLSRHTSYHQDVALEDLPYPVGQGITGRVALEGRPRRVTDVANETGYWAVDPLTRSELCVPLQAGGKVIGVINAESRLLNDFTETDERLLTILAGQLATAIERLRAEAAERQHIQELLAITRVSRETTAVLDRQQVLDSIVRLAAEISKSDASGLFTRSSDGQLYLVAAYGVGVEFVREFNKQKAPLEGTAVGRAIAYRKPYQIPDLLLDPGFALLKVTALENLRSVLALPMLRGDDVIGGIVIWHRKPRHFTQEEEVFLQALANQSVNAVENARLFDETRRRAVQQEAINAIIATAVAAPDLPELLESALDLTLHAVNVDRGGLWFPGYVALRGLPPEIGFASQQVLQSQADYIVQKTVISDWQMVSADGPQAVWAGHMAQFGVRASIFIPVWGDRKSIGGLSLASSVPREWLPEEVSLVEAIAQQLGSAVERLDLLAQTRAQAHQVQQIIDTVPEGVILLDAQHKVVLANPAAQAYLRFLAGEIEPDIPLSHLAGQPIDELLKFSQKEPHHELQVDNSPTYIFEMAAMPLEVDPQDTGWVLVLRDVTLEREIQARTQMQDRLATVGQLAAGIAHDFNNIMAAVVVYTDLLSMEANLPRVSRDQLLIIQKQVQRATSLIRQILDFSRRSVMEQIALDLLPFIKELDKLLVRVLPENIQLELRYSPGYYLVKADPTRLQQALMNLVLNARDAMPAGGVLQILLDRFSLAIEEQPPISDLIPGDWIRLQIKDTGIGISQEVLPHIFDPFFTTKPIGQGTGLGLAQVYGIVKQHGGSIDVYSYLGTGTEFEIYLPELHEPEEISSSLQSWAEMKGDGETILLVEDDQAAREALKSLLESQNYCVLAAENGLEAFRVFNREAASIALVVSDVVMPEMGGVELFNLLRQNDPTVKILFVTGHPLDDESQVLLEEGQVQWLQKPFSVQEFSSVLHTMMNKTS